MHHSQRGFNRAAAHPVFNPSQAHSAQYSNDSNTSNGPRERIFQRYSEREDLALPDEDSPASVIANEQTHDVVVVGASAGGVEALMTFVAGLPANLEAALFVVLHIPANIPSSLPRILAYAGPIPAKLAEDNEPIARGNIYVAPPDSHLLLTATSMRVTHGPHENWHRPAIDPLFRTAAIAFGARVVGIVLSGALNDGTAGLIAIKRLGGLALVQDPSTAVFPSMPLSACNYASIDCCLSVPALAEKVIELSGVTVAHQERIGHVPRDMDLEAKLAGLDPTILDNNNHVGTISELTCPQCRGPLWEIHDGRLLRFRCRVGHAFTAEALMEGQSQTVERNLWMALNSLEESTQLYSRLALSAYAHDDQRAREFDEKVERFQERMRVIREMLVPASDQEPSAVE
jgi:two-component system, chemotaxis family, protein-glutamate methylesterase/glutaminase